MSEQDKVAGTEQAGVEPTAETVELSGEQQIIAHLEAELAKAQAAVAEQQELALRVRADAENTKRRALLDLDKAQKFALEKFSGDMLSVVDNLERSLGFIDPANEAVKSLAEGVELTLKGLLDTLNKHGVNQIDPQGQPFNPDFHQAMSIQPHAELAPNTVTFVMQKGYELNGRLLRPALVGVSKKPD